VTRLDLTPYYDRPLAWHQPSLAGFLEAAQQDVALPMRAASPRSYSGDDAIPAHVGVLPITGILTYQRSFFTIFGFGTSVRDLSDKFQTLVANPEISSVVLLIDSPGGEVSGIPELADLIFSARQTKPILGLVATDAGSAAYWLASQSSTLAIMPSGQVGSIGVYMLHIDASGLNERIGVRPTYIYAGEHKVEGNSDEPLSPDARAYAQRQVDAVYGDFVRAVARGRGVSQTTVREQYGGGRMVLATDAVRLKMVDRIGTLETELARLAQLQARQRARFEADRRDHAIIQSGSSTEAFMASERIAARHARTVDAEESELEQQRIADVDYASTAIVLSESM
jgi:signal peptide peptidase SppA